MYILGIESSCDETAASVIKEENGALTVLSDSVATQIKTHALYGGVVPEIASREHIKAVSYVVSDAVKQADIQLSDLDVIGVTYGPGLIGSLLVGVSYAKSLAASLGKPLVNVNHIKAHAAASYIENKVDFPCIAMIVSGGHTSIYQAQSPVEYIEVGSTRDDAAGEAFDKVARVMGLCYPGGKEMDKLAAEGYKLIKNGSREFIHLPTPSINDETLDYSFSGLKTATVNYIHNYRQKQNIPDKDLIPEEESAIIAASFTKVITEGICVKLSEAIKRYGAKTIVLAGGVAANSHLRAAISSTCDNMGVQFVVPSLKFCGDNGAMVAAQTYFEYINGVRADSFLNAYATGNISV